MKSPLDWSVDRVRRTDAMFVQENNRRYAFGVLILDLTLFVAAVASWVLLPVLSGWGRMVAGVVVGLQLGRAGIVAYRRAGAYRTGWLRGRQQMVSAMTEAINRGMSPSEWLAGELARDYAVLGITAEDLEQFRRENEE